MRFSYIFLLLVLLSSARAEAASVVCTQEYVPVCGSKEVQCIRAPCYPVQQTYSNQCMLAADGAAFLHEGECLNTSTTACTKEYNPVCGQKAECPACTNSNPPCMAPCSLTEHTYANVCMLKADEATYVRDGACVEEDGGSTNPPQSYTPPANCLAWFDGCNSCSRTSAGGPAMCTLRACIDEPTEGYCTSYSTPDSPPTEVSDPPEVVEVEPPVESSPLVATTTPEPTPKPEGFLARTWHAIVGWFASLF